MGAETSRHQQPPLSSSWSHHHSSRYHRRNEDDIPEEEDDRHLPQSASVDLIIAQKDVGALLNPAQAVKVPNKMGGVHFADFSLFPDRFTTRNREERGRGGVEGGAADLSRSVPIPSIKVSKSSEPVGSYQGSNISKYNVRLR